LILNGEAVVEADAVDESIGGTTGGKSPLNDALAHTALEITALRARERLGQAERLMIAIAAWASFFVGHILNNIRGLFGT
jgi:hypothetical protein